MSDTMKVQAFDSLLRWILAELEHRDSIFGLHRSLFYTPQNDDPYTAADMMGHRLATPIGPAAGPHTQLAQNIIAAWLSGGRFIELKTVQIMDELEIPRPCIDMEDEGYNVEWSQELRLEQSATEYIHAWALIHILRRLLGFDAQVPFGTIFNMSVGYDLAGIQSPPMVRFVDQMLDASDELGRIQTTLAEGFPQFADLEIPPRLSDSVTLSTMHGCPPDEIERIARYLLEERGLHTIVKLNPTLLGKDAVMRILHHHLGYDEIEIPDAVFEKDLQVGRAVELIGTLKQIAAERGLFFGVKLSNTLAMSNHKGYLPGEEMYMSGRALYPITIQLFHKLVQEFEGDLNVSYAGGADALNLPSLLAAGARPVTACSDLLKPGGYSRFVQYLERLADVMERRGATSLDALAQDRLANLEQAAAEALEDPRYKKRFHPFGLPKVASGLELLDCISAPCVEQCAVQQDVPEYAWLIAQGEYDRALQVILSRNPLPGVTGYVCTHLCQTRCTRNNYDQPVRIRDLKRFAVESGSVTLPEITPRDHKIAVIGSGPSGLSAAFFLALNGVQVTIFEARDMPGGMLAIAPHFRLPPAIVQADMDRITSLGVEIKLGQPVTAAPEELLEAGFDGVYVACGFQEDARLDVAGMDGEGLFTALRFLELVARGNRPALGDKILVIGGGNTAIDAARTAQRLTGRPTTVVYRRSQAEMPAEEEELRDLLDEGNRLLELVSPERVSLQNGRVTALRCVRNELGPPGPDGRRTPVALEGTEFEIEADSIILAIGQKPDLDLLGNSRIQVRSNGTIAVDPDTGQALPQPVYAGGDVTRGPATIIEACADGRRAAEAICSALGVPFESLQAHPAALSATDILQVKRARARREMQHEPSLLPVRLRNGFDLVEQALTVEQARSEGERCLQCSMFCDKCVEVCPNRANYVYQISPVDLTLPVLACVDGGLAVTGQERFRVEQGRQIIHVDDFCNECGNCATFCVHQGKPYTDKPRLFLQWESFELEHDNAFYIHDNIIWQRVAGRSWRLTLNKDTVEFENANLRLKLSHDVAIREMRLKEAFEGTFSMRGIGQMLQILRGIGKSAPFLVG